MAVIISGSATPVAGSVATGDGTTLQFTAAGTSGQLLQSNGASPPTWVPAPSSGVASFAGGTTGLTPACATTGAVTLAGTLAVANGGTGQTTQQAAINALVGTQTANRVLRSNGTNMSLSQVALATDVSGTLPVANGGTGQTSFTNGQILIGNSTGNTLAKATLTAGCGVTITNGAGSITIAASGGAAATPATLGTVFGKTNCVSGACGDVDAQTALGNFAGATSQGCQAVAVGSYSANFGQGGRAVAIGAYAGYICQGACAIAIGAYAGQYYQGANSIVIGKSASASGCGAVALGKNTTSCYTNTVAIGFGTGATCISCRTHIGPVRSATTSYVMYYNPCTREVTYG